MSKKTLWLGTVSEKEGKSMRRLSVAVMFALAFMFGMFAGQVSANYMGSGHFPTSNLSWRYFNIDSYANYYAPTWSARSEWHSNTNVSLAEVFDSSWDIAVYIGDFGNTTWAGHAYICSVGNCDNSTAWNSEYYYVIAYINHYHAGGMSYETRKSLVGHELGHSLSLDHVSDSTSIMRLQWYLVTDWPNSNDIANVNARY